MRRTVTCRSCCSGRRERPQWAFRSSDGRTPAALPLGSRSQGRLLRDCSMPWRAEGAAIGQVVAPTNVPELRIVWLATQGAPVKEGDPVFRFDPSSAKQQSQREGQLLCRRPGCARPGDRNRRRLTEQDKIERPRREVSGGKRANWKFRKLEIVSRLQGEESRVDLGLAGSKLKVQKPTVELNHASNEAKMASLRRARDKAKDELELDAIPARSDGSAFARRGCLPLAAELLAGLDEREAVQGRRSGVARRRTGGDSRISTRWRWKARWKRSTAAGSQRTMKFGCASTLCRRPLSRHARSVIADDGDGMGMAALRTFRGFSKIGEA